MYVNMIGILNDAKKNGYAVCAPNINNEDTARAAIEAAEENRAPIILDLIVSMSKDVNMLTQSVKRMAEKATVPVALNQDHGSTYESAVQCIAAGMSSIMVDRSSLDYEENIKQVAELTKIAHAVGLSVESELGHVGTGTQYDVDRNKGLTDPAQARDFVERTGVDCLAVAIGTAHGKYVGTPYLDFELLEKLAATVDVPLVLHGGSGTGDENLAKAGRMGICKVNIGTDLYQNAIDHFLANYKNLRRAPMMYDLIVEGYKEKLVHYMKLFGQCNRY